MTKKEILSEIEKIIEKETSLLDVYNKAQKKMLDSPRIVSDLGDLYVRVSSSIARLKDLTLAINEHDKSYQDVGRFYGYDIAADGIVFTDGEEDIKEEKED